MWANPFIHKASLHIHYNVYMFSQFELAARKLVTSKHIPLSIIYVSISQHNAKRLNNTSH